MNTPRIFKKLAVGPDDFLRVRVSSVQKRLNAAFTEHISTRQINLDSGLPLEDTFRSELAQLIHPYAVEVGSVVDKNGHTPGECDIVIVDAQLSPLLLVPPSPTSRKRWFAYESTYGIVEVKQKLTVGALDATGALLAEPKGTLWAACEKIFACKQLEREEGNGSALSTNAPIGIVVCYSCDLDTTTEAAQDALLREFAMINSLVAPEHRVDALYVLDRFIVTWSFLANEQKRIFNPLQHPHESMHPVWASYHPTGTDTL